MTNLIALLSVVVILAVRVTGQDLEHKETIMSDLNTQLSLDSLEIVVLYDNTTENADLKAAWGFSCLIKGTDKTILFDTGGEGEVLLANMKALNVNPADIDVVVISHDHWDHQGGLKDFLALNDSVEVFMLESFSAETSKLVSDTKAKLVAVTEPVEILGGVYSTGEMHGKIEEHALILDTYRGVIVITGCAHPGIENIVKRASEQVPGELLFVMGGFHLLRHTEAEVKAIIDEFKAMGVKYAAPSHCTGEDAIEMFRKAYGDQFVPLGAGARITSKLFR